MIATSPKTTEVLLCSPPMRRAASPGASGAGKAAVRTPSRAPEPPWPSHSARRSDGGVFDAIALRAALTRLQPEPVEPVRPQGEEVRGVTHRGEARLAEQLHRDGATVAREVEAHRLRAPREIRDDEDGLLTVLADEGEHARVDGVEELDRAPPEGAAALPHRDE